MPGFEVIGKEEREAVDALFSENGGVLFAHGFEAMRNGVYKVREFEEMIVNTVDGAHCQVVSSGSAALLIALRALGVGEGDEVITSCFTFVATVEAILEAGAVPVLAEIDDTFNLDPADVARRITASTRVILPVHMAGAPARMDQLLALARERRLPVLEDAAQAFGATYRDMSLGTLGDVGCYSFDFGKCVTTGEGGAIVTKSREVFEKARSLHDHGHEYNPTVPRGRDTRSAAGFNYRMTEIQAAIGLAQLGKLEFILGSQRRNKRQLKESLQGLGLEFRTILDEGELADTLIFSVENADAASHILTALAAQGLGTKNIPDAIDWHFAGTWEHLLRDVPHLAECETLWPRTRALLERSIALPVNVRMSREQLAAYTRAIREARGVSRS